MFPSSSGAQPAEPTLSPLLSPEKEKVMLEMLEINSENYNFFEETGESQGIPPEESGETGDTTQDIPQEESGETGDSAVAMPSLDTRNAAAADVFNQLENIASTIVVPSLDNPDLVSYSSACSSKLLAMALSLKKRVCQFCLTPCRSQAGHKSCLAFYNRLVSLMLVYIQNEHHHTVRLTPIFIIEYLRLNYSLDPASLESILLYLQELFDAFWHDFEEFFKSFFRH